jgi:hypothetical protein
MTTTRARIVYLCWREQGASSAEIQAELGIPARNVPPNLQALEYQQRIYRAKPGGQKMRWFGSKDEAQAWMQSEAVARLALRQRSAAAKIARAGLVRIMQPGATPMHIVRRPALDNAAPIARLTAGPSKVAPPLQGEADMSRAKVTRDDRQHPTARWQTQPDAPAAGFSAAGIGRYIA